MIYGAVRWGAVAATTTLIAATAGGCAFDNGMDGGDGIESKEQHAIWGIDDRTEYSWSSVTSTISPIGLIMHANGGHFCSGALISPSHVLTAAHCVNDFNTLSMFDGNLRFLPHGQPDSQAGIVVEKIQGTGYGDSATWADFAILKLDRNLAPTPMKRGYLAGQTLPKTVHNAGYSGDLPYRTLGVHFSCEIQYWVGGVQGYQTNCDNTPGASGGPSFTGTGSTARIWGVNALSNSTIAGGEYFAYAPARAVGLGVSYMGNGRMVTYATDPEFTNVSARIASSTSPSTGWAPWYVTDSAFSNGGRMAGTRLADGRQMLAIVKTSNKALYLKWQQAVDSAWAGTTWMSPQPPVQVLDVAATGTFNKKTQLFVVGTDNRIYTTKKTGNANSPWANWCAVTGSISGLTNIAAFRDGNVQYLAWSSSISGTKLISSPLDEVTNPCYGWTSPISVSNYHYDAISLGSASVGVHVMLGRSWQRTIRHAACGTSGCGSVAQFPKQTLMRMDSCVTDSQYPTCPPYYDGLGALASGVQSGREVIVASTHPNGEMYVTYEISTGNWSDWTRYYK